MQALQTIEVTKRFSNHTALDKVSVEVDEQSIFGLLGPNGAGKTTLIRIINMITSMDHGQVLLKGKPITYMNPLSILLLTLVMCIILLTADLP